MSKKVVFVLAFPFHSREVRIAPAARTLSTDNNFPLLCEHESTQITIDYLLSEKNASLFLLISVRNFFWGHHV